MMSRLMIGIAGPSASGKTSLTEKIKNNLKSDEVEIIKYDDYYKNQDHLELKERFKTNYDHPNAFDNDLLLTHLKLLKNGHGIQKPIYDFKIHTRKKEVQEIKPKRVIILEGIFALLDEEIRELLNIKLYVSEDSDICFIRRLIRDTNERSRSQQNVIDQYIKTVKPMQEKFVMPTKKYADIIILRAAENEIALNMINDQIEKQINKYN